MPPVLRYTQEINNEQKSVQLCNAHNIVSSFCPSYLDHIICAVPPLWIWQYFLLLTLHLSPWILHVICLFAKFGFLVRFIPSQPTLDPRKRAKGNFSIAFCYILQQRWRHPRLSYNFCCFLNLYISVNEECIFKHSLNY